LPEIHRRNKEDQLKQTMGQKSLEQIQKELRAENEAFRKKQMAEIRGDYAAEISRLEKDIERLGKESERQEKASEKEKDAVAKQIRSMENTIQALSSEMEWLRLKSTMPKVPADVTAWVAKRYPDKLIFHDKAVALMKDVKPGEVDMELLCSALEFLAEEYRSMLTGTLTEDEMKLCCARKYDRPFTVTPQKGLSVEAYSGEYKIKYYVGADGKRHESPLDWHLKVGNDSENLIRIYFLYDSEKQLIVVGSLPKHLKTLTFG
jgi:hypothetical protein